ncbi:MAG TPA: hypothetical protein VN700_03170 [Vicinamibacterales bacterium]|nr:hypothetical protein [Vicinamibacterales bacterium]
MSLRVEIRRKLRLYLHDGKDEHVAHALSVVEGKDLAAVHTSTGALSMFSSVYPRSRFDFVTFVNAVHEISPKALVSLLIDCVERLSRHGVLYISDMERLPIEALELGAITWSRDDIDLLLQPLYRPAEINTSRWPHTKEYSWDAILRRASLLARPRDATDRMNAVVTNVLEDRLEIARTSLERLTISKPISQQEEENRRRLLYDYWAISRALNERT